MNYKSIYLIFLMTLLILPSIFALNNVQQSLGVFKQSSIIILKQTCADCTYNNITSVIYPNSTQAIGNSLMTQIGTEYNLTFDKTDMLGEYIVNGIGNPDGINTIWTYSFDITPSGSIQTTSQGLGSIAVIFLVIVLIIIFGYLGWKFLNNDLLWALGAFFLVLSLLLLVYSVWLVYEFKLNYTGSTPDAKVPEIIFFIFLTILGTGLVTAFFLLFTKWKVLKDKFKKAIEPEDDKDDII